MEPLSSPSGEDPPPHPPFKKSRKKKKERKRSKKKIQGVTDEHILKIPGEREKKKKTGQDFVEIVLTIRTNCRLVFAVYHSSSYFHWQNFCWAWDSEVCITTPETTIKGLKSLYGFETNFTVVMVHAALASDLRYQGFILNCMHLWWIRQLLIPSWAENAYSNTAR